MNWLLNFVRILAKYNKIFKIQMPKVTPHVCRHTFCSKMAKSGMNPKSLQYIMGHADISVTLNTYTHVKFEDAEAEMKKVSVIWWSHKGKRKHWCAFLLPCKFVTEHKHVTEHKLESQSRIWYSARVPSQNTLRHVENIENFRGTFWYSYPHLYPHRTPIFSKI